MEASANIYKRGSTAESSPTWLSFTVISYDTRGGLIHTLGPTRQETYTGVLLWLVQGAARRSGTLDMGCRVEKRSRTARVSWVPACNRLI
jgi:hypothetical protein